MSNYFLQKGFWWKDNKPGNFNLTSQPCKGVIIFSEVVKPLAIRDPRNECYQQKTRILAARMWNLLNLFHASEEFFRSHFMAFIDLIQIQKCNVFAYFIPTILRSGNICFMSKLFLAGIPCRYSQFADAFC